MKLLTMRKRYSLLALVGLLAAAGCQTQQQLVQSQQAMAIQTALSRARFDMNCQTATGTVLSTNVIQPVLQGPIVQGGQRTEFTIGVKGCGKRRTYIVICPQGGTGCYASAPQ
jgi:hypothetical protein